MFTDIHTGSNNPDSAGLGCGTTGKPLYYLWGSNTTAVNILRATGFPATIGWDPVSGLGTPKYPEMLAYFMSLS